MGRDFFSFLPLRTTIVSEEKNEEESAISSTKYGRVRYRFLYDAFCSLKSSEY